MDDPRSLVWDKLDSLRQETVELVSELVRIPSISFKYPGINQDEIRGGEGRCNAALALHLEKIGCKVDFVAHEPDRPNCVGVLKGAGGGRSLLFNGHIDTVPPGDPDQWKWKDPFSGGVEDGKVYGLGSCDMKGGIVAQYAAIRAIVESGVRLKGDLLLSSVVGEETMDHEAGTTAVLREGYRADAAIVGEPTSYPEPLTISPASPGLLFLVVNVTGVATHPGIRAEFVRAGGRGNAAGVNAVEKGALMLDALQRLEREWGFSKKHPFFKPGYFTIHPGVIIGGPPGPLVPFIVSTYCRIECIVWFPPQETEVAIKAEIESYLTKAAALDSWLAEHPPAFEWRYCWPPFEVAEGHPILETCVNAYERAARTTPRARPQASIHGFAAVCDATFLTGAGIPTVIYGPGDILMAHHCDEHVSIEDLMLTAKTLASVAIDWCSLD